MQENSPQVVSSQIQEWTESLSKKIYNDIYGRFPKTTVSDPTFQQKSIRDINYHLAYLAEAVSVGDESLFADYIQWVNQIFANLSFSEDVLNIVLLAMQNVLKQEFDHAYEAVLEPYISAGWRILADDSAIKQESFIHEKAQLGTLAENYLKKLLASDRRAASEMILNHVKDISDVRDVYMHVFQPVQYEIGRLWQTNQISVAEEHYCTAVTQLVMSQLYSYIFTAPRIGRRMVATSVSGELHEIGIRMVTDFFEMSGWDTYYLGANTPSESIISTILEKGADILAISATITYYVSEVKQLIQKIRNAPEISSTKILVGGYPFLVAPELWKTVGADGFAINAQQAVHIAKELI